MEDGAVGEPDVHAVGVEAALVVKVAEGVHGAAVPAGAVGFGLGESVALVADDARRRPEHEQWQEERREEELKRLRRVCGSADVVRRGRDQRVGHDVCR